jgi:hypothetical protein
LRLYTVDLVNGAPFGVGDFDTSGLECISLALCALDDLPHHLAILWMHVADPMKGYRTLSQQVEMAVIEWLKSEGHRVEDDDPDK